MGRGVSFSLRFGGCLHTPSLHTLLLLLLTRTRAREAMSSGGGARSEGSPLQEHGNGILGRSGQGHGEGIRGRRYLFARGLLKGEEAAVVATSEVTILGSTEEQRVPLEGGERGKGENEEEQVERVVVNEAAEKKVEDSEGMEIVEQVRQERLMLEALQHPGEQAKKHLILKEQQEQQKMGEEDQVEKDPIMKEQKEHQKSFLRMLLKDEEREEREEGQEENYLLVKEQKGQREQQRKEQKDQ